MASEDLSMEISRSAVARIRTENEDKLLNQKMSKAERLMNAHFADSLDKRNCEQKQLELDFVWDKQSPEPSCIELRMIILKNVDTGKRIAVYTNNRTRPLHEIALYMLNRWGKSENVYRAKGYQRF